VSMCLLVTMLPQVVQPGAQLQFPPCPWLVSSCPPGAPEEHQRCPLLQVTLPCTAISHCQAVLKTTRRMQASKLAGSDCCLKNHLAFIKVLQQLLTCCAAHACLLTPVVAHPEVTPVTDNKSAPWPCVLDHN
jgi:hypothetical protein